MADVEQLRAMFSGDVLVPGDPGYDQARLLQNGMIDKRPSVIARALHAADVVDAVNFGRGNGLEISVRGGGHNVSGQAVTDGGLMIDLQRMKGIHVDPTARTARAGGGVLWREFNRATGAFGLATTGGVISTTGIAGLTLGGGLGWLIPKFGMAVDNLLSAEVVLASGEVVTASEAADADLFWAIRGGGGGNFGIATSLEYRVHPLSTVLGGLVAHPAPRAGDVIRFYRDFTSDLSDDVMMVLALTHAPDGSGTPICGLAACHSGDMAQAEVDLKPVREFGPPIMDVIGPMPYPAMNTMLDDGFPFGARTYWKSAFLTELSDGAIDAMVTAFAANPSTMSSILLEHFHGAVSRVPETATAFPHRAEGYNVVIPGLWTDPADDEKNITWVRETIDALKPYLADRAYVNYLVGDESELMRRAYGPNYDRLVALKRRYDPSNVFRLNQNIAP